MTPFDRAILLVGSKAKLAKACHVSPQAASQWDPDLLPLYVCPMIERATGGRVRVEALRPETEWLRAKSGQVAGYVVRVGKAA